MPIHASRIEGTLELFVYRLMGAAVLDGLMYEGIEADKRATTQAATTVLLFSVAAGIGATGRYGVDLPTLVGAMVFALVTWLAWAMLMFQIGTRLLPEPQTRATFGELLRTTGFAAAPGLLQAFAVLPGMAGPVFTGTWIWMIAAMVIGVRHALDYQSTSRALVVCIIAGGLSLAMAVAAGMIFTVAVK